MSNITRDDPSTAEPPQPADLQSRISMRRAELIKVLAELKTDNRGGAAEARDKLKARLSELSHVVKWGVADGWASVGEAVAEKLEQWLAESARQIRSAPATTAAPAITATVASPSAPAKVGPS